MDTEGTLMSILKSLLGNSKSAPPRSEEEEKWVKEIILRHRGNISNDRLEAELLLYTVDARIQDMNRRFASDLYAIDDKKKRLESYRESGKVAIITGDEVQLRLIEQAMDVLEDEMHLSTAVVDKAGYYHRVLSSLQSALQQMLRDEKIKEIIEIVPKDLLNNFIGNMRLISDEVVKALEKIHDEIIEAADGRLEFEKSIEALKGQYKNQKDLIRNPVQIRKDDEKRKKRFGASEGKGKHISATTDDDIVIPSSVRERNINSV